MLLLLLLEELLLLLEFLLEVPLELLLLELVVELPLLGQFVPVQYTVITVV
jgi:hypothetical protein